MSTRRYLRASDFLIGSHKTGGRCRVCGKPARKGRRTTCSAECADRLLVLCHVSVQVWRVEKRDRGVCALCGWDTGTLRRIVEKRWQHGKADRWGYRPWGPVVDRDTRVWLRGIVGDWSTEVDHIVPVCRGGGVRPDMTVEDVLANLRTLCAGCHKQETRRLAGERATARRDASATLFAKNGRASE